MWKSEDPSSLFELRRGTQKAAVFDCGMQIVVAPESVYFFIHQQQI
jgi:hypothetical protein